MIWGGEQWQQIAKLEHVGAKLIDYSPQERYVITFNPEGSPKEDQVIARSAVLSLTSFSCIYGILNLAKKLRPSLSPLEQENPKPGPSSSGATTIDILLESIREEFKCSI